MFELLISDKISPNITLATLAKRLKTEVSMSKGIFVYDQYRDRERVCIAVPERYMQYVSTRAREEVIEHIAVEYKYQYFCERLSLANLDGFMSTAFLSALAVFDKATDKRYISDHLSFYDELNIDSAFNFRLPLLKDRWDEIVSLVRQNILELSPNGGLIEMMKFLLNQSPVECEEVVVDVEDAEYKIKNARGETQFAYNGEKASEKMVHQLITLLPKKVVVKNKDLNNLKSVFESRVQEVVK